jgi:Flp pilus assembly protein TadG
VIGHLRSRRRRERARGQSLVEFSVIVPVFLLILLGMLEFGFAFDQAMTITYASREGARSGAAFANGNTTSMPCATSTDVDKHIVAAVQRVLQGPGSRITSSRISEIRIYKADSSGNQIGAQANIWTFANNAGPVVDGQPLDWNPTTTNWNACTRVNAWVGATPPDSIGIRVQYTYDFVTPLSLITRFFGPGSTTTLSITDRSVMALNPTND